MLLSLLLTGLLTAQPGAGVQASASMRDTAVEHANNGDYEGALEEFRRLAASNPRDRESRLWIGRLHLWMGRPERAESVLRSLVLEDRASIDAKLGLALALVALERHDEAVDVLEQADEQSPENPEVLAALARAHRLAGNTTESVTYAQRSYMMAPTVDNRMLLEASRRAHEHRIESTTFFEDYGTAVAGTRSVDFGANMRMTDRLRVIGRGQFQRKFGISDQRAGLGVEWRWLPQTTISVQGIAGPGNEVLPTVDMNVEMGHTRRNIDWTLGVRRIGFDGAAVTVLSPGATWWASDRMSFGVRYAAAATDLDTNEPVEGGHTVALRGSYLVHPRVWANVGYTRGVENFDMLSPDQLGEFNADTITGGVRVDLATLTSIVGQYQHQRRPGDIRMNRITFSIGQRF